MRSVVLSILVAALVCSPSAAARTVVHSRAATEPRLSGDGLAWVEGGVLLRRSVGGTVTRTQLPDPGVPAAANVSATHALTSQAVERCGPARPGEQTTSCRAVTELLGGPLGGSLQVLGTTADCGHFHISAADVDRATAAYAEDRSRCGASGRGPRRYGIVLADLRSGARRTLAEYTDRPTAVHIAGDWVAWSRSSLGHDEIVLWRDGAVRRRIDEDALRANYIQAWDLQADGAVVAAVVKRDDGGPYKTFAVRPGRSPRPLGVRVACCGEPVLHVARNRVAVVGPRGLRITDLAGRSRQARGVRLPGTLADFDGRRGVWLRYKVLDPGVECRLHLPPGERDDCVPRPTRYRNWVVSDRIAR